MKRLVILSLYDGIGCGHEAINRAKLKYRKYYASEISPLAIEIAMKNHPDTIQVGDVRDLNPEDFKDVDVIIGGSPCTNFSIAGKGVGIATKSGDTILTLERYLDLKSAGVEMNESALFWEFIRMYKGIKKYNPNVKFFLENVSNPYWELFISFILGRDPHKINSSVITAQNRKRNYWTDIPLSPITNYGLTLGHYIPGAVSGAGIRGVPRKGWIPGSGVKKHKGHLTIRPDGKANCVTCSYSNTGKYVDIHGVIKDITPEEAEALQTLKKGYTYLEGISKSARFKLLGNAWTVDVVVKFFENLR